ncbi:uncharacterized protein METZ01_LOCUS246904 [marine metagenome]|uniref:Uncharacterized protein n=1 Tax=marine metagenome TaxID=408172 RepID=A0A382I316_9ZZZZ
MTLLGHISEMQGDIRRQEVLNLLRSKVGAERTNI